MHEAVQNACLGPVHAGVVKYLQQRYDLTTWQMRGASAGALVATLAACNVDTEMALTVAHRLAVDNGMFARPLGLAGVHRVQHPGMRPAAEGPVVRRPGSAHCMPGAAHLQTSPRALACCVRRRVGRAGAAMAGRGAAGGCGGTLQVGLLLRAACLSAHRLVHGDIRPVRVPCA